MRDRALQSTPSKIKLTHYRISPSLDISNVGGHGIADDMGEAFLALGSLGVW
jgi:hypothetical protein